MGGERGSQVVHTRPGRGAGEPPGIPPAGPPDSQLLLHLHKATLFVLFCVAAGEALCVGTPADPPGLHRSTAANERQGSGTNGRACGVKGERESSSSTRGAWASGPGCTGEVTESNEGAGRRGLGSSLPDTSKTLPFCSLPPELRPASRLLLIMTHQRAAILPN